MKYYVVDYDIPSGPEKYRKARHRKFYRRLKKVLKNHGLTELRQSSYSVFITRDKSIAEEIYNLAISFGQASLYEAKLLKTNTIRVEEIGEVIEKVL